MKKIFLIGGVLYVMMGWISAQYIFNNLTRQDGLSSSNVYCIYKDKEGFVWAGTINGLNRYDGSSFKVFNKNNKNFPDIPDESVIDITEYGEGKIWVGTKLGLYCYDKQTGLFESIEIVNEEFAPVQNIHILSLLVDPKNQLWIGTTVGLFTYKWNKAIPASCIYPSAQLFEGRSCYNLSLDKKRQSFWVVTHKGMAMVDYLSGTIESIENNPKRMTVFNGNIVQSMALDTSGNIWWSERNHPLAFYNSTTNSITYYTSFGNQSEWKILQDGCNRLFVDDKNRLWISNYYYKIFVREADGNYILLPNYSPKPFKPTAGFFFDIIQDEKGTIRLATPNGIAKLSNDNYLKNVIEITTIAPKEVSDIVLINCFVQIDNNKWWIGKDDGLYLYDSKTTKSLEYRPDPKFKPFQNNRIFDILLINNELWCATGDGMKIFNPATKQFRPMEYHPTFPLKKNKAIVWLYKDKNGYIWIPLWLDALCKYNPVTEEMIRYDGSNKAHGDIGPANILSMLEIDSNFIWFNYGAKGIRIYDKVKNSFTNFSDSMTRASMSNCIVYSMVADKDNNVWASTPFRGVLKFDPKGILIDSVNTANGFNSLSVFTLALDSAGIIWAITPDGIQYFNPKDKIVSKLNINLQLPTGDGWNTIRVQNDSLMIANMDRLVIIDRTKVNKEFTNFKPLITAVTVFEKEIPFSSIRPSLELKYNENFFTIAYSSPQHDEDPSLQYTYILEGFDKNWVKANKSQIAAYTNVPDGDYRFLVKCHGPNDFNSEMNIVPIHIHSPFWKRWWFPTLIIAIVGSILGWISIIRTRNYRKKEVNKTIDYFVNSVYGENSVNEICWDIARNCISKLHFEDCVVYLYDEQKDRYVQKSAFGPKNPKEHEIINQMEIEIGKGIVGAVAATGKPLLINDTSKDERYIVDDKIRLSELTVPIIHDGKVIGIIDSEHSKKNFFTEEHLKAVSSIASISANKIAEAQAEAYAKENEIKLLEINKLLAESQLMALRAQMNPHFVFNCLNSIQECIVTQKYGEASNYLNKFSKLFRTVLNNSGKNLVSINEEKEVLELYLVLEHMRFDQSFDYKISVDEDLEADEILIPSMLVQPYVENALWHGLMHKQGERILKIEFNRLNENVYECIIDDNGIGRAKSFDLKEQQSKSKRHESKGLKISKDRLDVLSRQGYHTNLEIIDKPDNGGTTVKIELSTYLNY